MMRCLPSTALDTSAILDREVARSALGGRDGRASLSSVENAPTFLHPAERPATSSDVVEQVQQAIHAELGEGRAIMAAVAGRLQVSERTLRRRLNDRGTTFRAVLDEVRCERALHSLHDRSCSGAELAGRLGFSCPTAFYRAFRRWTGTSLSRYDWRQAAALSDTMAGGSTPAAERSNSGHS